MGNTNQEVTLYEMLRNAFPLKVKHDTLISFVQITNLTSSPHLCPRRCVETAPVSEFVSGGEVSSETTGPIGMLWGMDK